MPQWEPSLCVQSSQALCAPQDTLQSKTSVARKSGKSVFYLEKSNSATLATLGCVGQLTKESLVQGE